MFKVIFIMAALAVSISASAQQNALSLIKTGKYSYNTYGSFGGAGTFDIITAGNSAVFKDLQNKVNYFLNVQTGMGLQMLPEEFLKMSRERGASAGAASLVKSIGISNVQASRVISKRIEGKVVQEGSITGTVVVEIEYNTAFGNINGTVEMLGRVDVTRQNTDFGQYKDNKWISRPVTASVLRANVGDFMKLTRFESNLPTALNNVVGMLLDIGLRISSLSLRSTDYLSEDFRR